MRMTTDVMGPYTLAKTVVVKMTGRMVASVPGIMVAKEDNPWVTGAESWLKWMRAWITADRPTENIKRATRMVARITLLTVN